MSKENEFTFDEFSGDTAIKVSGRKFLPIHSREFLTLSLSRILRQLSQEIEKKLLFELSNALNGMYMYYLHD